MSSRSRLPISNACLPSTGWTRTQVARCGRHRVERRQHAVGAIAMFQLEGGPILGSISAPTSPKTPTSPLRRCKAASSASGILSLAPGRSGLPDSHRPTHERPWGITPVPFATRTATSGKRLGFTPRELLSGDARRALSRARLICIAAGSSQRRCGLSWAFAHVGWPSVATPLRHTSLRWSDACSPRRSSVA